MKNYAGRGGCYPPKLKAEVDNTLRDLHNSSFRTKAEFNHCFIIHSKYDEKAGFFYLALYGSVTKRRLHKIDVNTFAGATLRDVNRSIIEKLLDN